MLHGRTLGRWWVVAEVRPPGTRRWERQGLFIAARSAEEARERFREELLLRTGWTVSRKVVRRILRVQGVRELLGR